MPPGWEYVPYAPERCLTREGRLVPEGRWFRRLPNGLFLVAYQNEGAWYARIESYGGGPTILTPGKRSGPEEAARVAMETYEHLIGPVPEYVEEPDPCDYLIPQPNARPEEE